MHIMEPREENTIELARIIAEYGLNHAMAAAALGYRSPNMVGMIINEYQHPNGKILRLPDWRLRLLLLYVGEITVEDFRDAVTLVGEGLT